MAGACRRGMTRVVLPRQNEKHFERDVGDDVRRRVTVHYVRRVDDGLDLVLLPVEAAGDPPPESPAAALARKIRCAVTRRYSSAGANPARQLSLPPVAVGADDGGNDIG